MHKLKKQEASIHLLHATHSTSQQEVTRQLLGFVELYIFHMEFPIPEE